VKEIPAGFEGRVTVVVTHEMTVDFADLGKVHPVYATYWMVRHMEEAGRKIILPFLEEGEEGIGSAVGVRHLAPALPGMGVEVVAVHERTEGRTVFARCSAFNELGDLIGEGHTEQVILDSNAIRTGFEELEDRWRGHRQPDAG
jgi:fluoroacetyl-CoA thioesterase